MAKDYYKTLGVSKSATAEEIKKAYRKLALQYHPDRGGDKETEAKFKEVNEAYQVLSDPAKRRQYDQFGDSTFRGNGSGGQGFGGFDFSGFQGGGFGDFDFTGGFGDILGDFFGQAMSQVQAELQISPAQAVLGDKISVEVGGQRIDFEIPPGTQSGDSFRFAGKGRSTRNGKKGDLILTMKIVMPRKISREQADLWEKLRESEHKKSWWQ